MNKREFGGLIAALRRGRFDPQKGRVWSQARLAQEAGLTEKIVGDIERGSRRSIDANVAVCLANAFNFNTLERKQFFALLNEIDDTMLVSADSKEIFDSCLELTRALQMPAMIHDGLYNVLAMNGAWQTFYQIPDDFVHESNDAVKRNLLRLLLDESYAGMSIFGRKHYQVAEATVTTFRWMSLRYRHTDEYAALFERLMTFSEFGRIWMATQFSRADEAVNGSLWELNHKVFGRVKYTIFKNVYPTLDGPLYTSCLLPTSPETTQVFATLMKDNQQRLHDLASNTPFSGDSAEPLYLWQNQTVVSKNSLSA